MICSMSISEICRSSTTAKPTRVTYPPPGGAGGKGGGGEGEQGGGDGGGDAAGGEATGSSGGGICGIGGSCDGGGGGRGGGRNGEGGTGGGGAGAHSGQTTSHCQFFGQFFLQKPFSSFLWKHLCSEFSQQPLSRQFSSLGAQASRGEKGGGAGAARSSPAHTESA